MLKNFSIRVLKHLRITDICFRQGLNKILVVLPNTNIDEAQLVCNKLAKDIKAKDIVGIRPYPEFCFTVDAGFAEANKDSQIENVLASVESKIDTLFEFIVC